MTEQHPDREAIDTARGLTGALEGMTGQLKSVAAYGHRSRRMIWGLIISIMLDLILTAAVAVTAVQAHDASTSSAQTRNAAIVSCRQTNTARAQNDLLWQYVLSLFDVPRPGETTAQKQQGEKELAALRDRVGTAFAPRDCDTLLKGKP